jgi:hypothetical protein
MIDQEPVWQFWNEHRISAALSNRLRCYINLIRIGDLQVAFHMRGFRYAPVRPVVMLRRGGGGGGCCCGSRPRTVSSCALTASCYVMSPWSAAKSSSSSRRVLWCHCRSTAPQICTTVADNGPRYDCFIVIDLYSSTPCVSHSRYAARFNDTIKRYYTFSSFCHPVRDARHRKRNLS